MNNKKDGSITIRIDHELLNKYKSLCEKNGYDISKRIRLFIQQEISNKTNDKTIQ